MKKLPPGTKLNPWKLWNEPWKRKDGSVVVRSAIRRRVTLPDGKVSMERLPAHQFRHLTGQEDELKSLVRRLNAEIFQDELSIHKILDRNAFLSPQMVEKFEAHRAIHSTSEEKVQREMSIIKHYILGVFVAKFGLTNPADWIKEQDRWYEYLLSENAPGSAYTKKYIVQILNKFMKWLHRERPLELSLIIFEGFTQTKLKSIERDRMIAGDRRERSFIPPDDWEKIYDSLPEDIKAWIVLCRDYGLRRSESLGLAFEGTNCVFQDGLELKRQLVNYDSITKMVTFGRLKSAGRTGIQKEKLQEKRLIPHWLGVNPETTCDLIEAGMKHLMHPDTLTKKWRKLMKELGFKYDIHELRHDWITRALKTQNAREVQLAAGQVNIETTMRYGHDDRTTTRQLVRPKK